MEDYDGPSYFRTYHLLNYTDPSGRSIWGAILKYGKRLVGKGPSPDELRRIQRQRSKERVYYEKVKDEQRRRGNKDIDPGSGGFFLAGVLDFGIDLTPVVGDLREAPEFLSTSADAVFLGFDNASERRRLDELEEEIRNRNRNNGRRPGGFTSGDGF